MQRHSASSSAVRGSGYVAAKGNVSRRRQVLVVPGKRLLINGGRVLSQRPKGLEDSLPLAGVRADPADALRGCVEPTLRWS